MIDECAKDAKEHLEAEAEGRDEDDNEYGYDYDDNDGDGDSDGEGGVGKRKRRRGRDTLPGSTFTIVCSRSLVGTVSALIAIVDKAVSEVEALLTFREKQRKALLARIKNSSSSLATRLGTLDGHISDDEDDGAGVGMKPSVCVTWTDSDEREYRNLVSSVSGSVSALSRFSGDTRSLRGLNRIDDAVFMTLHRLFEAASCLLHPVMGDATERVLGLFCRLFKMQTRLTRTLVSLKVDPLPVRYQALANFVAQQCSKRIDDLLVAVRVSLSLYFYY
jgi:phage gp37-like protein